MRYGTSNLRSLWRPWQCARNRMVWIASRDARFEVADAARDAFEAAHVVAQAHGYVLNRGESGAFICRRITGGSGLSLHAFGIAEDWNWQSNPYAKRSRFPGGRTITDMPPGMVADVKAIRAKRTGELVFRWGGDYNSIMDAMHWEIVVSPADLADGVDWRSVAGAEGRTPTKSDEPPSIETVGRDNPLRQPVLKRGTRGPTVKKLQRELTAAGIEVDDDGIFGKMTDAAVRRYQASRSLVVDGIVGKATWTALLTDHPQVPAEERPGRDPSTNPTGTERTTTVEAGEGWYQVAARALGNGARYTELQALNGGDRMIHPGEVLVLPD